jgi:hypothetical protein
MPGAFNKLASLKRSTRCFRSTGDRVPSRPLRGLPSLLGVIHPLLLMVATRSVPRRIPREVQYVFNCERAGQHERP